MLYDDTQIPVNLFIDCIKGKIKILYYQQYTGRWNLNKKKTNLMKILIKPCKIKK